MRIRNCWVTLGLLGFLPSGVVAQDPVRIELSSPHAHGGRGGQNTADRPGSLTLTATSWMCLSGFTAAAGGPSLFPATGYCSRCRVVDMSPLPGSTPQPTCGTVSYSTLGFPPVRGSRHRCGG